jgi:hypothetical protein
LIEPIREQTEPSDHCVSEPIYDYIGPIADQHPTTAAARPRTLGVHQSANSTPSAHRRLCETDL